MASASRRRQRSTRLTVAVALLVLSAVLVAAALLVAAAWLTATSAVLAVVLGAAATRITHAELMQSRRDAAQDRAAQAKAYRDLTVVRLEEHRGQVDDLTEVISGKELALAELEAALIAAQHRAAESTRRLNIEARRADLAEAETASVTETLTMQVEEADERAAMAIAHLAELEHEIDALRSELAAWQQLADSSAVRKHA